MEEGMRYFFTLDPTCRPNAPFLAFRMDGHLASYAIASLACAGNLDRLLHVAIHHLELHMVLRDLFRWHRRTGH
jgi:hypothetical protein